ncbi:flagellar assembly peptidoglycan hydrolase FlgJ [Lysobacter sp. A3-1-A15]
MRLPAATAIPMTPSAQPSRERLQTAARELETQFAQMMLKTMRSTSMGDAMFGGNSTYRDMHDQQLARELGKSGLGLAPMIVQQLERSSGMAPAPVATPGPMALHGRPPGTLLPLAMPRGGAGFAMPLPLPLAGTGMLSPSSSGVSIPAANPMAMPVAPAPEPHYPSPVPSMDAASCEDDAALDCSSPEAFVRSIWPHAQATAAELGVSPKALVAQAALETGWGRKLVGGGSGVDSHNLFGIKATGWAGDRVSSGTHEYVNGVRRNETADFRAYASAHDSFADYARLLRGSRYAGALEAGTDASRFASALQRAGYATDPNYAAKISAIVNGPTLNRALASLPGATRG